MKLKLELSSKKDEEPESPKACSSENSTKKLLSNQILRISSKQRSDSKKKSRKNPLLNSREPISQISTCRQSNAPENNSIIMPTHRRA